MKIKKVLIEVCKEFSPHCNTYTLKIPNTTEYDFRVNVFFGGGRYFFFYSGLFGKRRLKRNTWLLELILNRERIERARAENKMIRKPFRILEGVTKEEGRYKYEEMYVSAYLMRRLLGWSTNPESFNELEEVYEN